MAKGIDFSQAQQTEKEQAHQILNGAPYAFDCGGYFVGVRTEKEFRDEVAKYVGVFVEDSAKVNQAVETFMSVFATAPRGVYNSLGFGVEKKLGEKLQQIITETEKGVDLNELTARQQGELKESGREMFDEYIKRCENLGIKATREDYEREVGRSASQINPLLEESREM
jgi:uncharacterized protein Yka (UPF0111/DUF47 family)